MIRRDLASTGCYSHVGRRSTFAEQYINLGRFCLYSRIIIHELIHALGFFHEHNRLDRNDYVFVDFDNVRRGKNVMLLQRNNKDFLIFPQFSEISEVLSCENHATSHTYFCRCWATIFHHARFGVFRSKIWSEEYYALQMEWLCRKSYQANTDFEGNVVIFGQNSQCIYIVRLLFLSWLERMKQIATLSILTWSATDVSESFVLFFFCFF